jgi:hypothetical protein
MSPWWETLHDVVLERIDVTFEHQNEVIFHLRQLPRESLGAIPIASGPGRAGTSEPDHPRGAMAIRCSGFRRFTCPRLEPWGRGRRHAFINEARLLEGDATASLFVQLSSGDEIEIEAGKIEWVPGGINQP